MIECCVLSFYLYVAWCDNVIAKIATEKFARYCRIGVAADTLRWRFWHVRLHTVSHHKERIEAQRTVDH